MRVCRPKPLILSKLLAFQVCRTALGFAGGRHWLKFEDPKVQSEAVATAMGIVQRCMIGRHEGGMEILLAELDALSGGTTGACCAVDQKC